MHESGWVTFYLAVWGNTINDKWLPNGTRIYFSVLPLIEDKYLSTKLCELTIEFLINIQIMKILLLRKDHCGCKRSIEVVFFGI